MTFPCLLLPPFSAFSIVHFYKARQTDKAVETVLPVSELVQVARADRSSRLAYTSDYNIAVLDYMGALSGRRRAM